MCETCSLSNNITYNIGLHCFGREMKMKCWDGFWLAWCCYMYYFLCNISIFRRHKDEFGTCFVLYEINLILTLKIKIVIGWKYNIYDLNSFLFNQPIKILIKQSSMQIVALNLNALSSFRSYHLHKTKVIWARARLFVYPFAFTNPIPIQIWS